MTKKTILDEKNKQIDVLEEQVRVLSTEGVTNVLKPNSKHLKIGVISDTHFGSLYDMPKLTKKVFKRFKDKGVTTVYHAGDVVDGNKMFRGHEFELRDHGMDEQLARVVNDFPQEDDITTYFITGSHDLSFYKQVGMDIGDLIDTERDDMIYLGRESQDVRIKDDGAKATIRLVHPGGGTAYALSYHPQKYIESLSGGKKPNIVVFGHYHKAEFIPCYRNVFAIQAGCLEKQTPFMQRKNLAAHIGHWILDFDIDSRGVNNMNAEFFAHYER